MLFRRRIPEYTDGEIDLIPLRIPPPADELEFGNELNWRITKHGSRREIGRVSYRDGESRCIYYYGHIGYHIDPAWRGKGYAGKACLLIAESVRVSGKSSVVITCDPDNVPSRKTCERLGCVYESTVSVPGDIIKKFDTSPVKCRYIWLIQK